VVTRRVLIDQLSYYSDTLGGQGAIQQGPVILAWVRRPGLEVGLDSEAQQVGDMLAVLPAQVSITGRTVFGNSLIGHSLLEAASNEAFDQGSNFQLGRGTMVVEFRPMGFGGEIDVARLALALTVEPRQIVGDGKELPPLPRDQQPDQADPVGSDAQVPGQQGAEDVGNAAEPEILRRLPAPIDKRMAEPPVAVQPVAEPPAVEPFSNPDGVLPFDGLPDLQLFDREAGRWVEFMHPAGNAEYTIANPGRYVDSTGTFRVRFVNRADPGNSAWFTLVTRLEGTVR
jgi:hypothetical protein